MRDTQEGLGPKRLVLVVGGGRGASLLSGILGRLGFHVPQPEVGARDTDPPGFGEPRWVVRFHRRLLRDRGVTVFDPRPSAWESLAALSEDEQVIEELTSWLAVQFVGSEGVVVNDSRNARFLPLWRRCADGLRAESSFATLLRHPAGVIRSARTSYGIWQSDASRAAAWLNVNLHAEHSTRDSRRAFVRTEDLLEDWARELSRCGELLDVPWLAGVDPADHPDVEDLVDRSAGHSAPDWDQVEVPTPLQELCEDVWAKLCALAAPGGDTGAAREALDAARAARGDHHAEATALRSLTAVRPRLAAGPSPQANGRGRSEPLMKRIVPLGMRESLRASDGLPVAVRLMLLVPLRYRERMPVPAVDAARRVVRALRR